MLMRSEGYTEKVMKVIALWSDSSPSLTADTFSPSSMSKVKMFLHKPSIEKMKANHAVISETNKVGRNYSYSL